MMDVMPKRSADADLRLTLSREQMRSFGYEVIDLLIDHFEKIGDQPVGAKLEAKDAARFVLEEGPPEQGCDPSELLTYLKRDVFPNNLHLDHPRFFAFVPSPGNFVSTMADVLASGFNVFVGTWLSGSAAASMELLVIEWLRRFCGMP
jgi:glutamate/tyrosine decarboxylase-like PLP-dependent enzyme